MVLRVRKAIDPGGSKTELLTEERADKNHSHHKSHQRLAAVAGPSECAERSTSSAGTGGEVLHRQTMLKTPPATVKKLLHSPQLRDDRYSLFPTAKSNSIAIPRTG